MKPKTMKNSGGLTLCLPHLLLLERKRALFPCPWLFRCSWCKMVLNSTRSLLSPLNWARTRTILNSLFKSTESTDAFPCLPPILVCYLTCNTWFSIVCYKMYLHFLYKNSLCHLVPGLVPMAIWVATGKAFSFSVIFFPFILRTKCLQNVFVFFFFTDKTIFYC